VKARLQHWATTIDALGLRERIFLLLSLVAVLFLLMDTLVYQPALDEQRRSRDVVDNLQARLTLLELESHDIAREQAADPLAWRKRRVAELEASLDDRDEQLRARLGTLVEPRQAAPLLRDILAREPGLTLLGLETEVVSLDQALFTSLSDNNTLPTNLARYQLTLRLEGSYLATLRFLERLDTLPWALFSEQLELEVEEHPRARITLRLYTLGAYGGEA
jgi:MSHA biogenesis protein MshJ